MKRQRFDWLGAFCIIVIVVGCAAAFDYGNYGLIKLFAVMFPAVFGAYALWAWRESR